MDLKKKKSIFIVCHQMRGYYIYKTRTKLYITVKSLETLGMGDKIIQVKKQKLC